MKKVLLSIAGSLLAICGFAQMSGTYTINGAQATGGTNYQTFPAAISALYSNGINGPVTFNVIEGTYANQQLYMVNAISGSSTTNTVTFQSASSNTNMPVITNTSYIYYMYNANLSNVAFKGLRFEETGSSYLMYTYNANLTNILWEDCEFIQNYSTYINYAYYSKPVNVVFDGCLFQGGYYQQYMYYLDGGSSISFLNCDMVNYDYMAIYTYSYSPYCVWTLEDNYIAPSTSTSSAYLTYMYYVGAGSSIQRNKGVGQAVNYNYGMLFYYPSGNSGQPVLVRNNVLTCPNANSSYSQYGLRMYYPTYANVDHNTMMTTNSYSSSYAAYLYWSSYSGNNFRNNIVTGGANGYTQYTYYFGNTYTNYSNNVYYRYGSNDMRIYNTYTGGTYSDLSAWQSASSNDANSVMADPNYLSNMTPIPQSVDVDDMGTPIGVTVDINGNPRSSTSPDPGAYEFSVPTNNAQPTDLLTPDAPLCDNDTAVITVLKNTGLVTLSSVIFNYSLNGGTASTVNWTGSLAPGASDTVTVIANTSFSDGDNLRLWTSMPNGVQDSAGMFDTLEVDLFNGMSGTYSIPNDYATFAAAVSDLMLKGVCDDVVFSVSPGTYSEQISIGEIAGTSEDATVTFTSSTGDANDVVIEASSSYTVNFSGGDWVTFDAIFMKNSNSNVVTITGTSNNLTIDNCRIKGAMGTSTSTQSLIYRTAMTNNLTITNSRLEKGSGYFYSTAGSTGSKCQGLTMEDNTFEDMYYYYGLYVYYQDGFEFNRNVMKNDSGAYYPYNYYAIYMQYVDNFNITRNYISGDNAVFMYGIYMGNSTGRNNPRSQVANNCIMTGNDNSSYGYYPLYAYNSGIFQLSHNSFTANGYSNSYVAYLQGGLIDIWNNSFANLPGGYTLYVSGGFTVSSSDYNNFYTASGTPFYYGSSTYSTLEAYQNATGNDMHSIQTDPAFEDAFTCVTCNEELDNAGTPLTNVMDDISGNARSVMNPDIGAVEYVTPATFTLGPDDTICGSEIILEAGPAQSVSWNINGQSYSTPSVELSATGQPITYNVFVNISTEFCGSGSDDAIIRLVPNANLDAAFHLCADEDVTLQPGGGSTAGYVWSTGDLTPTITVDEAGTYTVVKTEEGCESEATTVVTQSQAVQITDVEACSDDMPVTLDATILDGTSYAWSGGTSITSAQNTFNDGGSYSVTASDSWGCSSESDFSIIVLEEPEASLGETHSGLTYFFDATGSLYISSNTTYFWDFGYNGMTSTNPTAIVSYPWAPPGNLASYNVSLTIDNGCGVDVATMSITPDPVGVEDIEAGSFALYPNPANEVVKFMLGSAASDQGTIEILDIAGRMVASQTINSGATQGDINISSLSSGSYMVKITIGGSSAVNTLIKQ